MFVDVDWCGFIERNFRQVECFFSLVVVGRHDLAMALELTG